MTITTPQVITPGAVAALVGTGGYWTKLAIARALGREKTTHVCNQIDLAFRLGYVNRIWSNDGVRDCWMYTVEQEMF